MDRVEAAFRKFDSDGDGWWDGALHRPENALVVPLDGTPTCTGAAADAAAVGPCKAGRGSPERGPRL